MSRIILASNQDLAKLVESRTLVPPGPLLLPHQCRQHHPSSPAAALGDIPLLSESFLKKLTEETHRKVAGFTPEAMDLMRRYTWPGNVRELENAIERAVVLTKRPLITADDLPQQLLDAVQLTNSRTHNAGTPAKIRRCRTPLNPGSPSHWQTGSGKPPKSKFFLRPLKPTTMEPPTHRRATRYQSHDAVQKDETLRPRSPRRRRSPHARVALVWKHASPWGRW